ncbi:MAG: sodium:solute symporter [Ignavibacteriaceae bacterium]
MVEFSKWDVLVIGIFAVLTVLIGLLSGRKSSNKTDNFLLAGRNVGLFTFVLINVSTWYGGILGVGEFSYRYGLLAWFTQGLPYYLFAILFALFFVKKIRSAQLFTIPEKIFLEYGRGAGMWAAILVFILVTPAPYLLMIGGIIDLVFQTGMLPALIIGAVISTVYLFRGGFRANVWVDSFLFFVMFGGFIVTLGVLIFNFGGISFLKDNLPVEHLTLTGDASPFFIIVWFLIASWTFADPGFHQRTYSAVSERTARRGIIISVFLWALFDFLTNGIGLYSRALLPGLENPVLSYPLLAEKVLSGGLKGLFYAAMFATIISTLNSFLFLSATTISMDFVRKISPSFANGDIRKMTGYGLVITSILSVILAYAVPSVITMWYTIGSVCIPSLLILIITAYYPKLRIRKEWLLGESILAAVVSFLWLVFGMEGEPMLIGLGVVIAVHTTRMVIRKTTE